MRKREVLSKLKQMKENGFSLQNPEDIRSYIEVFGEDSLMSILQIYNDPLKDKAKAIIQKTGFAMFKEDPNEENSAKTSYRVSDISTFSHYKNLKDGKDYISFTMSNGIKVTKRANTAMAIVLIEMFTTNDYYTDRVITPETKDLILYNYLDNFYKPQIK